MTAAVREQIVSHRAAAYDDVYRHWHAKRVTVESFERWARFFLDTEGDTPGHLNGDEIACAFQILDVNNLSGKRVLDLCCGTGRTSIYFALRGAIVAGVDVSQHAIEIARASAELSGVSDRANFTAMDAQRLEYGDGTFDSIYCQSALHILIDYPKCAEEIARVLKPGCKAIFCEEALGHNRLLAPIRWWRRRKYESCGGRPLMLNDIHRFGVGFARVELYPFNLLSQIKMIFVQACQQNWCKRVLRPLHRLDTWLLRIAPFLLRYCGKVVVVYTAAGD